MISYTVDTQVLNLALTRLEKGISDFSPAWDACTDAFYRIEVDQFASEGARGGARWQALSAGYSGWKDANYGQLPILYLRGNLKQSLLGVGPDAIKVIQSGFMEVGSRDPKAVWHQLGMGRLPVRKSIDLNPADFTHFGGIAAEFMETVGQSAGFETSRSFGPAPTIGSAIRSLLSRFGGASAA